jgi:hypothetical protein
VYAAGRGAGNMEKEKTLVLVRYSENYSWHGDISRDFVCTEEQLELLKSVGTLYWFDELGKHSEGEHHFNDHTLKVILEDQELISKLLSLKIIYEDSGFFDAIKDQGVI